MSKRVRVLRWSLLVAASLAVTLGAWEWHRRSQINPTALEALLAGRAETENARLTLSPEELLAKYQDPQAFQQLCDDARRHVQAMGERTKTHEHIQVQVTRDLDKSGAVVAAERHVERIFHKKGHEYRQTVELTNALTGRPKPGADRRERKSPEVTETFPLSVSKEQDEYVYTLDGVEQLGDQWTVRIAYEPRVAKGRFVGKVWVAADTHEPRRLYAVFAEKKPFVDQFTMLVEYGPGGDGILRQKRCVIDGSGGFAMIQKHYRSEIEIQDFTPHPEK